MAATPRHGFRATTMQAPDIAAACGS